MMESEWLQCTDPVRMLQLFCGRTGERKMRLFACACARSVWTSLSDECCRQAVEVAERFADGLATGEELAEAGKRAYDVAWSRGFCGEDARDDSQAEACTREFSVHAAAGAIQNRLESQCVPDLIREVFGNPFRTITIDSRWLTRQGERAVKLAQEIYQTRTFERLPTLADVLSQAGCSGEELLAHLRMPQPHYRGCWALDLLLGKGPGKDVVTEEEWQTCMTPRKLFEWWAYLKGDFPHRKRRLLACACCRRIWYGLSHEDSRQAVEVAERYADGKATRDELAAAQARADAVATPIGERLGHLRPGTPEQRPVAMAWNAAWAAASAAYIQDRGGMEVCVTYTSTLDNALNCASQFRDAESKEGKAEQQMQCCLFRDIFGNPFLSVRIDPAWLAWNGGSVVTLAQAIHDERTFDRLPILADALEEAGCTDANLLEHCRAPGVHVLGCWVLDSILDKGAIPLEAETAASRVFVEREL
jgi:hypothetical protein